MPVFMEIPFYFSQYGFVLKSGIVTYPNALLLSIAMTIYDLLQFCVNFCFKKFCFYKNVILIFMAIVMTRLITMASKAI